MTIARELVRWVYGLRLEAVPDGVRAAATRHLLDGLGTAVAAGRLGAADPVVTVALGLGGPAEATVLGTGQRIGAPAAALANGTLLHALDFDDTHAGGLVHATAVVLPAALAVGERASASGREVLTAAIAGYETVCRVAAGAPHAFHARGMHATAVCGVFSSAVVAARLDGLSEQQAVDALGIAGSQAGGLLEFLRTGSATKQMHPGLASQSGALAARLAAAGATGPDSVLEGDRGVYASLAGRSVEPSAVLADLGQSWETTRISIKPYPACQLAHASLDAGRAALNELSAARLAAADIAEVTVEVHPDSAAIVAEPAVDKIRPRTPYDAKFSVQWSLAALLLDGDLAVATYAPACVARPEVSDVAARVRVRAVHSPGVAADAPARITVRLADGRKIEGAVPCSSGTTGHPMDDAAVLAKFTANAGGPSAQVDELARRVGRLADQPSLDRIVALADRLARRARPHDHSPHPTEESR